MDNTSGQGKSATIPKEIRKWNWGAFFLPGIWSIGNKVWIGLLVFLPPPVLLVMPFVLGAKGNEWAWRKKRWQSTEHFLRVQERWGRWGFIFIFALVGSFLFDFAIGKTCFFLILFAVLILYSVLEFVLFPSQRFKAYYGIGAIYCRLKNYPKAILFYKKAIRINSEFAEAHYNLGWVYSESGQLQAAIESFQEALRINPNDFNTYRNLGVTYAMLGRYQEALSFCKKAISINPNDVRTHFGIGLTFLLCGDKISAFEQYKILKKLNRKAANKLDEAANQMLGLRFNRMAY